MSNANLGGLLLFVGVVLTVSLVLMACARRRDRGFIYDKDGPIRRRPEDIPLLITYHPDLMHHSEAIGGAVKWWNAQLGFEIFFPVVVVMDSVQAKGLTLVNIQPGPNNQNPVTRVAHKDGVLLTSPIEIPPGPHIENWPRVFAHELGHALGLDHDPEHRGSVMHPTLVDGAFEVTEHDRKLLQSWYG